MLIYIVESLPNMWGFPSMKLHTKGGVERSVVDIPFASCGFTPVQFDSNLTRQLYNTAQGIFTFK